MIDSSGRFRIRVTLLAVLSVIWMGLIGKSLFSLQVNSEADLSKRAERQQQQVIDLNPMRGTILDRTGRELVRSLDVDSVWVSPSEVPAADRARIAKELSRALKMDVSAINDRLQDDHAYVPLKRRISYSESDAMREVLKRGELPGIHIIKEPKRFYTQGELASQLLGLDNSEGKGVSGIEQSFENILHGKSGKIALLTDAKHHAYDQEEQAAVPGQTITLTLDAAIQAYTEQVLSETLAADGAESGVVIVMDPRNGEVLAMASGPSYNPNNIAVLDKNALANRAVQIPYEPGSVFKLITYSAAVEEKLITPDSVIDAQGGSITIVGHTIRDGGHYGLLRASDALAKSSNVAAIKIGQSLGQQRLYEYIRKFGLGDTIGREREFYGESRGIVRDVKRWSDASYGSIPIGYEVAATPLQLLSVISTIANDGVMVQPHLIKKISSESGTIETAPPAVRRIISRESAATMREMLGGVVTGGTAKPAQLAGYTAGGKTGTAHKFDQNTKRYSPNHYYASFAGFAPLNNPQLAIMVMINDPKGAYHGGQVAAPVFKRVAEFALDRLGIQPDLPMKSSFVAINDQHADSENDDETTLPAGAGLGDLAISDPNAEVIQQLEPGSVTQKPVVTAAPQAQTENRSAEKPPVDSAAARVPDFRGRGARSSAEICAQMGMKLVAKGSGVVVDQNPKAGTAVQPGSVLYLTLGK